MGFKIELTEEQKDELDRLLQMIAKIEGLVLNSSNREQVERLRKEARRNREKVSLIIPEIDGLTFQVNQLREQIGLKEIKHPTKTDLDEKDDYSLLEKFPSIRVSLHSTDNTINQLATVLQIIQKEYWPVITEQHCQMDFSHNQAREGLREIFDANLRTLKILAETIEEYASAEKQDFREQLLKMKNKQSRMFIYETTETLKKIRAYLQKLAKDIVDMGNIITNKDEPLRFNRQFEDATILEGTPLSTGILEFKKYTEQAIKKFSMPELKGGGATNPLRLP